MPRTYGALQIEIGELKNTVHDLQFKIDNLMLEYCPEDITPAQFENWKAHQKPVETP
jgi:hypothetical protein